MYPRGGDASGGCIQGCIHGDAYFRRGCVLLGVHSSGMGCILPVGVHPSGLHPRCSLLPVNIITRACENITLPHTSYTGGNKDVRYCWYFHLTSTQRDTYTVHAVSVSGSETFGIHPMLRCGVWATTGLEVRMGRHQWDQTSSPIHLTNLLFTCPSRFHNVTQMPLLSNAIQIHSLLINVGYISHVGENNTRIRPL